MKSFRKLGIALCSVLLMTACGQKKAETANSAAAASEEKPLVTLAQVVEEPVAQIQVYSATIVGEIKNNIAPATPARISKINVEVRGNSKGTLKVRAGGTGQAGPSG